MQQKKYFDIALKTALYVAPLFKKSFGRPRTIDVKKHDPHNLVTEIDRQIEKEVRRILNTNFPQHKIIGEEFGAPLVNNVNSKDLVWIIDPIDGTTNYIQALPFCCISIALWDNQGPVLAVVYNPMTKEIFTAQKGQGAYLNKTKIQTSPVSSFAKAYGGFGWGRDVHAAVKSFPVMIKSTKKIRTLGSSALEICLVAKGVYDFYVQKKINVWDFAAAALILKEAGGRITDAQGQNLNLRTNNILATNGKIHREILNKIKA